MNEGNPLNPAGIRGRHSAPPSMRDPRVAAALGVAFQNHFHVVTIKPSQIAAGRGTIGSASYQADGPMAFHLLNTADVEGAFDFEVSIKGNGFPWSNRPVSARALCSMGLGRRFADLLEGRPLLLEAGDTIDVDFHNLSAGAAINPRLHLIGHRGWPADWRWRGVFALSRSRPFVYVLRDPADASVATGATNEDEARLDGCYSFARLSWSDGGATTTGHMLDIDLRWVLGSGHLQTVSGDGAGDEAVRASLRALCGDEGLDLTALMSADGLPWPQVMELGARIGWKCFNDSGSTVYPRVYLLGHEGMPLGHVDYFRELAIAGAYGEDVKALALAGDLVGAASASRQDIIGHGNPVAIASA